MMNQSLIATDDVKVIVGLGQTGFSCVEFLSTQDAPFAVVDSRDEPPFRAAFEKKYSIGASCFWVLG